MEGDRDRVYVVEEHEEPAPTSVKWKDGTEFNDDENNNNNNNRSWIDTLKSFTLFTEDRRMSRSCQVMTFVGFFLAVAGSGEVGRQSTSWLWPAGDQWADELIVPPYAAPPQMDVSILMLLCYLSISFSAWRISMRRMFTRLRVAVFVCVLLFNCLLVPIFYGWRQVFVALLDAVLLLVCVVVFFVLSWQVEKKAGCALIFFLLWVVYENAVVAGYWWLNYDAEGFYNVRN